MAVNPVSVELARRAQELLGDGEWHNYERTVQALARVVPPGVAIRQNEKDRVASNKTSAVQRKPRRKLTNPKPPEALIAAGARTIVREFLTNPRVFEATRATVSRDPERKVRMVAQPRALAGDPYRQQRDRLEYEVLQLREAQDRFIAYLKDNGHADAIDRLLAGPET